MQVFTYLLLLSCIIKYQCAPWIALRNCLVLWITCKHSWGILGSILVVILLLIRTYTLPSVLGGVQLWLFSFFSIYVLWSSGIFLKVLQSGRNIFPSLQRFFILKNPQIWPEFTLTNLSIVLKDLVDIVTLQLISLKWCILQHFRWLQIAIVMSGLRKRWYWCWTNLNQRKITRQIVSLPW